jgi:hypothetical protein
LLESTEARALNPILEALEISAGVSDKQSMAIAKHRESERERLFADSIFLTLNNLDLMGKRDAKY